MTSLTAERLKVANLVIHNGQQVDRQAVLHVEEEPAALRQQNITMKSKDRRPSSNSWAPTELYNLPVTMNDCSLTSAQAQIGSMESVRQPGLQSPSSDLDLSPPVTDTPVTKKRLKQRIRSSALQHLFRHRQKSTEQAPSSVTLRNDDEGLLFGLSLDVICQPEGTLPHPLLVLLACIYHYGPETEGIFRCSPNARTARKMKLVLDSSMTSSSSANIDMPVHVATHLLKELLRGLPNCLLRCELYGRWIETLEFTPEESAPQLKQLIGQLSTNHRVLLCHVVRVLQHISHNNIVNQMTSSNLGVCIGPSLLWAPTYDPPAVSNSGTLRRAGGKLLGNGKSLRTSTVALDNHNDLKDANLPSLIVQRLIDMADILFHDSNWSAASYDVIHSPQPLTAQFSKSISSLDDSDAIYDDFDWTKSLESQQSNVSDVSEPSRSNPVPVISITPVSPKMSPVPPPRTKKLHRQKATAVFVTSDDDNLISPQQPAHVLPVLQYNDDEDTDVTRYEYVGRHISNDSLLDEKITIEYDDDDTKSYSDAELPLVNMKVLFHESTQSLTSGDGSGSASRASLDATQRTDSFLRRSSAPVGETDEHMLRTRKNALNRRQFQQLSTDSAISADIDVDNVTSVFPVQDFITYEDGESQEITVKSPKNTYADNGCGHGASTEIMSMNNLPKITQAQTTISSGTRRRGMTSSGADLFPVCMRTSAVAMVVTYPCDVIEIARDSKLMVTSSEQDSNVFVSRPYASLDLAKIQQHIDFERKRKKLLRLRDRFAHRVGSAASSSSSSVAESSSDEDDNTKKNELFRRRQAYQRRSYNTWRGCTEKKTKNVERAQSDSVRVVNRQQSQRRLHRMTLNDCRDTSPRCSINVPDTQNMPSTCCDIQTMNSTGGYRTETTEKSANVELVNGVREGSNILKEVKVQEMSSSHVSNGTMRLIPLTTCTEKYQEMTSSVPEYTVDEQKASMRESNVASKIELPATTINICNQPVRQRSFNSHISNTLRVSNASNQFKRGYVSTNASRDIEQLPSSSNTPITSSSQLRQLKVKERHWHTELVKEYSSMTSPHVVIARRHSDCIRSNKGARFQSQITHRPTPPSVDDNVITSCQSQTHDKDFVDGVVCPLQNHLTEPFELRNDEQKLHLPREIGRDNSGADNEIVYSWSVAKLRNIFDIN